MTGKCPECNEIKEITQLGSIRGMCDECYDEKYTCDICNKLVDDAWLWVNTEKGKGHKGCIEGPKGYETTESPNEVGAG